MIKIVKVQFHAAEKLYDFNSGGLDLSPQDRVIVETDRGRSMAIVATSPVEIPDNQTPESLKTIVRKATPTDLEAAARNRAREKETHVFCQNKIAERNLDMKLVKVEYIFDGSKAIFYFTADGRVDFRELVKDLAHAFHTRIEMRQIGVRDESKMVGGIGICGRELCCSSYLREFEPVSVKMAKEQNLALNPTKISGQCGRLLCCLSYEFDTYCSLRKCLPKCGKHVRCGSVEGEVVKLNVLQGTVTVKSDHDGLVVLKGDDIKPENITDRQKKPQKGEPDETVRQEAKPHQPTQPGGKSRRDRRSDSKEKSKKEK